MTRERRTLILTGASRGIGHATVKHFCAEGWRVITVSRHAFSKDCPWEAGPENHVQIDLSDPQKIERGIEILQRRLDGASLGALVNNAGISPKGSEGNRLGSLDTDLDLWREVFQVNFYAPLALARGLFDELRRGRGSVVNVTSIADERVHPFAGSAYATSKAALAALTREMAADFGPLGIRVNAIAPGEIDTPILSPHSNDMLPDIPMARFGKPSEVAGVIYFLCSGAASYITGGELHVNGGQHV